MRERGLSHNRFAPRIGVTQSTLSKWLRGDAEMTLTAVDAILAALDIPVDELLQDDEEGDQ